MSFAVTNTGRRAGTEIAQVYLGLPEVGGEPGRRLVGWAHVLLEPGECQQVTVRLAPQSLDHLLSYWEVDRTTWEIAQGEYQVYVGASSRDIRLTGTFHIEQSDQM